ncbi:KH domain-containing protein [Sporolactobacillus sp. THM7-7]|nr:KH domain-containing protein [Sporolactobacillus sp. THM7-7]
MDELIKAIVTPLVDDPDDVLIQKQEKEDRIVYVLSVNKEDMGKVIGRKGRVVGAIRTVVSAAARAEGKRVQVVIRE